ncbi:MAG: hypothetical protein LBC80_03420 [Treponema sp.]|jgi:hypothetical protein|nr:hypothetical protein [Treponema sp.]
MSIIKAQLQSYKKHFLVLAPHRDVRVKLQKYSDAFIDSGLKGVYKFPLVAPLAVLSKPLTSEELKQIAHSLREIVGKSKINAVDATTADFPADSQELRLLGHCLDLNIPINVFESIKKQVKSFFSPLIIGSFLIPEADRDTIKKFSHRKEELSFRAAAVANMSWQQVQQDSEIVYRWEIGKLCWLPRIAEKKGFTKSKIM